MENYYANALKAGQKYYRNQVATGKYPYLPALEDMLPSGKLVAGGELGLTNVPAEFIIGTKTSARSRNFAGNFMPIAAPGSEFASKWNALCNTHVEEGIRDPVLLYEYMNRFYAEEGNKRVSVLKFVEATSVLANVRRIVPEKSDDPKVVVYFEFVDFYNKTGINYIEFSRSGSFAEFEQILGKGPNDRWTDDEKNRIQSSYYNFKAAFEACGGDRLHITPGDAMLAYIRIYGFDVIKEMSKAEMKKSVSKAWQEITLEQEEEKIQVNLDSTEVDKASVISKILPRKSVKAGFLYLNEPDAVNWVYTHELGRKHAAAVLGDKVETAAYYCANDDSIETTIKQMIEDGAEVIFTTSAEMLKTCLKVAIDNPNIEFLNCSMNLPHKHVRSYYPRMYEGKFIAGAVAGAMSPDHRVGYVGRSPVYGSIAEINAFARGVQLTDPEGKVYLKWSAGKGTKNVAREFEEMGINLISVRDHVTKDADNQPLYGLEWVENDIFTPLVLPTWDWGVLYEKVLRSIIGGTFRSADDKTNKSLIYYWGLSTGMVDLFYSSKVPKGVRYLAETLKKAVVSEGCYPFYNPEVTPDGRIDWSTADSSMSIEDIMNIDYLEDNVVGEILKYEEMDERNQKLIDIIGVKSARKQEKEV